MNSITNLAGGEPTMSSREIADLVGSRHDKVKQSVERLAERGVITRPPLGETLFVGADGRRQVTTEYRVGKRDSYVIVAQLSPEFTARLVDRWQELEAQAANPFLTMDRAGLLRVALESEEKVQALEHKVAEDAPKVEFYDKVSVAPGAITLAEAAKILGTGRTRFAAKLRQLGWLRRNNEPYQDKIEAGLLDVKLSSWEHPDFGVQRAVTPLITGKGLTRLRLMNGSLN